MGNNVKYIEKYQKENTIQVNLRLSKKYDADIIDWLNILGEMENMGKVTYIKKLIRKDMGIA